MACNTKFRQALDTAHPIPFLQTISKEDSMTMTKAVIHNPGRKGFLFDKMLISTELIAKEKGFK